MRKTYEVKIFNLDGTFQETLLATELISDFTFSAQINGGQGEAVFDLDKSFGNTTYVIGDFVKVYVYSDTYVSGKLLYSGMITRITRKITSGIETIKLTCVGLASILNFIYFYQATYSFNKNEDPAITIKSVIDYFNSVYTGSWFSYSGGGVINYGSSLNTDFSYNKCFDVINSLKNSTNYWWYIGADGQILFQALPGSITHTFTLEDNVDEILLEEDGEKIVNRQITTYKTGTAAASNDVTSQASFGIRELQQNQLQIVNNASAVIYSDNYVLKNKDFKKKTSVIINSSYDLESITPGDTIKILNIDYTISNLQIQKITYTTNNVKLELETLNSLSQEIFNS